MRQPKNKKHNGSLLPGLLLVMMVLPAALAFGANKGKNKGQSKVVEYDIHEESTAVTAVSVVSPDNLYVWNTPTMIDDEVIAYSGKQWIDDKLSTMVSIWKGKGSGGVATKLVSAGQDEVLWSASTTPDAERLYFSLDCRIHSTTKAGTGGRMQHISTGYCDYNPEPFYGIERYVFSSCQIGADSYLDYTGVTPQTDGNGDCFYKSSNYIWTVNHDGTELIQLRTGSSPTPSPDGTKIAFDYQGDIWLMNMDGSAATNITQSDQYHDYNPGFSPDGTRLVFNRIPSAEKSKTRNADIWIVDVDGTRTIQLTMNAAHDFGPVWTDDDIIYFVSTRGALVGKKNPKRIWRMKLVQ